MSAIQSSVGLISGIPIQDTVDQLISVASRPRNLLAGRNREIQAERSAVDTLASLVLSLQGSLNRFNAASTFNTREVSSSDESTLAASIRTGASPRTGSYQFTPIQTASAHQVVSNNFTDPDTQLGGGTLGFRFGGHVDQGIDLSQLNAGNGVSSGQIKITDRSGASATIDLRAAQTVDDVLDAINSNSNINITASIDRQAAGGDAFKLTDNTGGTGSIQVQEIGLGTTAADLGFNNTPIAAAEVVGSDVFSLHADSLLSDLNDGSGVRLIEGEADIRVELSDGTVADINLDGSSTLEDVTDAINNHDDLAGKISASIASDGNRIELTDTSGGGGTFSVTNFDSGSAADDLGLTPSAVGATISGNRLASGLQDTLVSRLNGGRGIELGSIDITDRAGNSTAGIDLSTAETLGEIVDLINASVANVTAAINSSRSGIELTDTSGGSGNFVVSNNGGTTADDLGIAIDDAVASINSGSLNRQIVGQATLLDSLKGGEGVTLGDVRITDSSGAEGVLDLNRSSANIETIGDVIDAINGLSIDVTASINDSGDGILITDTAGGSGSLSVVDINGSTATDLQIAGESSATDGGGNQIIDGTTSFSVDLSNLSSDPSDALLSTLNDGSGVQLGVFQVVDTEGTEFTVNLGTIGDPAVSLGDVVDRINAAADTAGSQVTAEITSNGTGITITDSAGGSEELTITDLGDSGTAAADLGIAGEGGGDDTITAFGLVDAEVSGLEGLAARINDLQAGVTASVITTPAGSRLSILANATGAANELLIDDSAAGFSFSQASRPQDAVLLYGGVAVSSDSNAFDNLVDGLDLTASTVSDTPVTITVEEDTEPIVSVLEDFVAAYNSIRTNLDTVTDFDEESNSTGILFGRNEALRVDTDLGRVASGLFAVGGDFQTLESLGISLEEDGKLSLDRATLNDALAENSRDVERLLTDEDDGVFAKFSTAIDSLAGEEGSLLDTRSNTLERTIDNNIERLERYDETLEIQRTRLLTEFFRLEETIALLQSNLDTISSIQPITFATARSSNSNQS